MANFQVIGGDLQRLLIELGDGDRAYAEGGHLIWKSSTVRMRASLQGGLLGGLRRLVTGATFFVLELEGPGQAMLSGFAPGSIIRLNLEPGRSLLAEHRSFLAAESSVKYETKLVGLGFGWLGGEGLWMAKFEGPGAVFLHSSGAAQEIELAQGESIDVEAGHLLAMEPTVKARVSFTGVRTMFFGGEGIWMAHLEGPGRVWVRSISRQQMIMGLMPEIAELIRGS